MLDSTAAPAPSDPVRGRPSARSRCERRTATIRVLIVDDHSVVRMGLRMFFDLQADIEVVGEAADGSEGVAMARRLEPDVVLMDLLMPNMDGITAIGRIKAERPETEIVTMTSFIEEEKVTSALEAGASGYVLKDAEAEEVAAAVRAAYAGEVHLDPAVARLLAQRLRTRKSPEDELAEPLTEREKDVIRLLGQGMSNKEIGAALFITERTARTYVSNILGKLGLASRTQAALYAVEHKLVDDPQELSRSPGDGGHGYSTASDPVVDRAARRLDRRPPSPAAPRPGPARPVTPSTPARLARSASAELTSV